jgi:hypothetical protein
LRCTWPSIRVTESARHDGSALGESPPQFGLDVLPLDVELATATAASSRRENLLHAV